MNAPAINRDMVVAALSHGFTDSQIANSLGVTQSAVSQAIDAYGLRERAGINSKFAEHDDALNNLEAVILKKLAKATEFGVLDPIKLAAIYKVLNGAKRRSMAEGVQLPGTGVQLININLPQHVQVKVGLNSRNEVVSVGDNPLNTLPAGRLVDLAGNKSSIRGALSNDNSQPVNIADII